MYITEYVYARALLYTLGVKKKNAHTAHTAFFLLSGLTQTCAYRTTTVYSTPWRRLDQNRHMAPTTAGRLYSVYSRWCHTTRAVTPRALQQPKASTQQPKASTGIHDGVSRLPPTSRRGGRGGFSYHSNKNEPREREKLKAV